MDISGISASGSATSRFASSAAISNTENLRRDTAVRKSSHEHKQEHEHDHRVDRARTNRRANALGIFKQEFRMRLSARSQVRLGSMQEAYSRLQGAVTPENVAADALGSARQIAADSPVDAARSLISFRAIVHETANFVRQTLGAEKGYAELENTLTKVDEGLAELEDAVARNLESSASVLDIDTRSKQRTTIRIRTQEGDVVKLSLRREDRLSASDSAQSSDGTFSSVTEVEISSRSRMKLQVEGDLNESELAAIQNVFAQAEEIANEFFGGDIGAAFSLAEGFEFDAEQLARVNLGFRVQEVSSVSFAESVRGAPVTETNPPVAAVSEASAPPADEPSSVLVSPAVKPQPDEVATTEPIATVGEDPISSSGASALSGFIDMLSSFIRSVNESFTTKSGRESFEYHYSESFKLELLKAVIHTVAPEDSAQAAANAESVIGAVKEATVT